jgi:hypothetical protein
MAHKSIELLENQIKRMIDYLLLKVNENDWHGVCDAANDLRVLEAELKVIREISE